MRRIEALLTGGAAAEIVLRPPRAGDIGWVIERHAAIYAAEYGFDTRFEAMVADVAADYLRQNDPTREACWIAERDGVRLGSAFVVRKSGAEAKLRLLIVEPAARGIGLGKRLVDTCMDFARLAGYQTLSLWTNDVLLAARGIYRAAGFRLISTDPHSDFGPAIVGEEWSRPL